MTALAGLSAFSVTPMNADGVVDLDHLQRLVSRLADSRVDSIGVLGSTGCYMYLAPDQRDRAMRAAVEAAGAKPVLAGIGALTTRDVLRHADVATKAGAAGLLLAPASYLPLTSDDFTGLVQDVAQASDLPICLYNNPTTTHFTISEELVIALAQNPSVAAVKNPSPRDGAAEQLARLRASVPDGFVLGYSGDALIDGPLAAGADAWYSVIAGTLPELGQAIWDARQDPVALNTAFERARPLWTLFNAYGGIRVIPEILNRMGLGPAPLPKPLLPLSHDAIARIETALEDLN
jgi:4-hydroxy-tetrahydrodipicolinate synthase